MVLRVLESSFVVIRMFLIDVNGIINNFVLLVVGFMF